MRGRDHTEGLRHLLHAVPFDGPLSVKKDASGIYVPGCPPYGLRGVVCSYKGRSATVYDFGKCRQEARNLIITGVVQTVIGVSLTIWSIRMLASSYFSITDDATPQGKLKKRTRRARWSESPRFE